MQPERELNVSSLFEATPEFIRDPYQIYRQLRESDPIHKSKFGFYVLSRHADVSAVLHDNRFGRDYAATATSFYGPDAFEELVLRVTRQQMLFNDPPEHSRLRRVLVKAFSPHRVNAMRETMTQLVHGLIDGFEARGHADLIREYARPIPLSVICEMLGVPEEDRELFMDGSKVSERVVDPRPMTRDELDVENERAAFIVDYFRELCARRRVEPKNDLTTALLEDDGDQALNVDEALAQIVLLFVGGHFTTVNLIGNGLLALHRNPEQLQLLAREPKLMPNAVEELLRYDASVQATGRIALEDAKAAGMPILKGKGVVLLLASANRDPDAFVEPDRLDITRSKVRGISFGRGIHHCLGAQLARIEGEVGFGVLLQRLPNLQLDDLVEPDWTGNINLRGLATMNAHWD
jgi:cytochrome P450